MFGDVLLGLLSDGTPRHGYELVTLYRARTDVRVSPGNVYRELSRLAANGLVQTVPNEPDADARRIPYRITGSGRRHFAEWLDTSLTDETVWDWLLFADRLAPDARRRLLERRREDVEYSIRVITRKRDDLGARPDALYDPALLYNMRALGTALLERDALEQVARFFARAEAQSPDQPASAPQPPDPTPTRQRSTASRLRRGRTRGRVSNVRA
jgi:DNA-binding PadR family transcriptional regulator